jgi:predicted O-methyltransferase YrrM
METDDAHILQYLYRYQAPRRHFEFGTWKGAGVVLCAESCGAEIWTINLPDGEKDAAGRPIYQETRTIAEQDVPSIPEKDLGAVQTDAGEEIGKLYRQAGYAHRVHQILADSFEWRGDEFEDGFFDSVLIDGGHSSKLVSVDTQNAIRLTSSGGMVLWHDLCPVDQIMSESAATRGVVAALHLHWRDWSPQFDKLFWIRPSYLLLGIKK